MPQFAHPLQRRAHWLWRGARATAIALFLTAGGAAPWPSTSHAATVSCPDGPLLSEELARAPSVFVASVRTVNSNPETPHSTTAVMAVEEIWRGPELAPIVRVHNEPAAGAPLVELVAGGRYLVVADPVPVVDDPAAATVSVLRIQPCSATRALTADLGGLRPSDARVMPGFEAEGPSASRENANWTKTVTPWLWVLAAALIVIAGSSFLARGRWASTGTWLPWRAGGAAVLVTVAAVMLTIVPASRPDAASPSHEPAAASSSSPTTQVDPGEDPTLVVRLEIFTELGPGPVVSVHADGRVISTSQGGGGLALSVQGLTPEGLELIRGEVAGTGLFDDDAPSSTEYRPVLRPGVEVGGRGGYGERLTVDRNGAPVTIWFSPSSPTEAHLYELSPEIDRLEAFAQRLFALGQWLPAATWSDPAPSPYGATRFEVTAIEQPIGMAQPALPMARLSWPISTSIGDITPVVDSMGNLARCAALTRNETAELLGSVATFLGDPSLSLASVRVNFPVDDAANEIAYHLTVEALFPDEAACAATAPVGATAALAPGAIALVRVADLRVRESVGSGSTAIDAFQAGERLTVVAGPVVADGNDWYQVRQGPGDRGGWVSSGPPCGDPWIVPIGNGTIAFLHGGFDGGATSVQRMDRDGTNLTSIGDGYPAAWTADGRRIAISLPPAGAGEGWRIAVADADGSGLRILVEGEDPAWSPDATIIAFVRHAESGPTIHLIGADGDGLLALTDGAQPAWSPDGGRIAFIRQSVIDRPSGDGIIPTPEALWVIDPQRDEEKQLTPAEVMESSIGPAWSPDGSLIAFGSNRLIAADDGDLRRLEGTATWGGDMPWSPDGEDLAVITEAGLHLQSVDTGQRRMILPVVNPGLQLAWSPDGRSLAYSGGIEKPMIFIIGTDGGAPVQIGPADAQFATWQPLVDPPLE